MLCFKVAFWLVCRSPTIAETLLELFFETQDWPMSTILFDEAFEFFFPAMTNNSMLQVSKSNIRMAEKKRLIGTWRWSIGTNLLLSAVVEISKFPAF